MGHKQYAKFFEDIKKLKDIQNKQKQRGLNDFNILTVVRKPHLEVGMHSNFLYALLNTDGLHYQDDLFVNLFIKYVLKLDDFGKVIKVNMEDLTSENRRIDFTIQSEKYEIGIEMKIYAADQNKQIYDYYNFLSKKSKNDNKKIIIYYLTLNGKDASIESHNYTRYEKISFEKEILQWLEICQYKVQNITNLNEAIKEYMDVIKSLIGTYKSKISTLSSFIMTDKNLFNKAQMFYIENEKNKSSLTDIELDAIKAYEEARIIISDNFFTKELIKFLEQNLDDKYQIEIIIDQEDKYKIIIEKNDKKVIFGSQAYSTNQDYYQINNSKKIYTKYRYRFDNNSINEFFLNSDVSKEYYLQIISDNI